MVGGGNRWGPYHLIMDFMKDSFAGWFGGVSGMIVGHPFDTVKSRLQTQGTGGRVVRYRGTLHCFRDIIKTEGTTGLYKGLLSPLVGMAAINSIIFGVYGSCIRFLQPEGGSNKLYNSIIAGAASGTVQCSICIPTELIKLRMQLQNIGHEAPPHGILSTLSKKQATRSGHKYIGPLGTAINIVNTNGVKGLYKGSVVTVWREAPAFATYFATYDHLCQRLATNDHSLEPVVVCMAGGLSGMLAWVVTYPFDVVKSRVQSDGLGGTKLQYRGMIDCFRKSYMEDGGVRVFFRGINATLLRAFPVNAATFLTVELIQLQLKSST